MGGSHSTQSISASAQVTAKIVQDTVQGCLTTSVAGNTLTIDGSGNQLSDVQQRVSISVSAGCQTLSNQSGTFKTDLDNSIAQNMRDQTVAMTQWMDNSRRDSNVQLSQSLSTNLTQSMVQNCTNSLNGQNVIVVRGDNNVVQRAAQDATLTLIAKCMQQNGQAGEAAATITNAVNQQQTYVAQNPLAFVGDAVVAALQSVAGIVAILIVVVVCLVLMYKAYKHHVQAKQARAELAERAELAAPSAEPPAGLVGPAEPPGLAPAPAPLGDSG